MSVISRLLDEHDKDAAAAARELRGLEPSSVSSSDVSSYSWLLNHVLGELQDAWSDAYERQQQLASRPDAAPAVYRAYAVAAFYAGKPSDAWAAQASYTAKSGATAAEADVLVRLGVLQCSPAGAAETASFQTVLRDSLAQIKSWKISADLAPAFGSLLNNIVSHWLEQTTPSSAAVNELMQQAAERSRDAWQSGTWVNQERAWYLQALVANHVGRWEQARDAAHEGIKLIESNGEEDVDRAMLLLELARALKGLSQPAQQQKARDEAVQIAETFSEPGLREWFDSKLKGT